ncbi:hypothetical protein [Thermogymnomonas acidicola]|uniref:hypothetical protein n=1 Tax=Thermogymnomonas acidicola TaxID=399579 RepID=UPI0009466F77|nr:hypothetical protein [Thermogymnomonas acidicola]
MLLAILVGGVFFNPPLVFGTIYGISGGLFWGSNNVMQQEVTRGNDRLTFLSLNSTISGIISLVGPVAGALIIGGNTFPRCGQIRTCLLSFRSCPHSRGCGGGGP